MPLKARWSGPPGWDATQRWAATEPALRLAGISHSLDAMALCHRCWDRRVPTKPWALVRLGAGDELAALAALVAVVPGLGSVAPRLRSDEAVDARDARGGPGCAAWQVIRSMGGTDAGPASLILSRGRETVRSAAEARAAAARVRPDPDDTCHHRRHLATLGMIAYTVSGAIFTG